MEPNESSHEILEAISTLSTKMDERLDTLEARVMNMASKIPSLVTKEYLDNKLADLRADFGGLVRKEDAKVDAVIDTLVTEDVLTASTATTLKTQGPFVKAVP